MCVSKQIATTQFFFLRVYALSSGSTYALSLSFNFPFSLYEKKKIFPLCVLGLYYLDWRSGFVNTFVIKPCSIYHTLVMCCHVLIWGDNSIIYMGL